MRVKTKALVFIALNLIQKMIVPGLDKYSACNYGLQTVRYCSYS